VETLEALEARLAEYSGTLIAVSHDRHFLDAVVTSTLVFEEGGAVRKYAGGYSDWARRRHSLTIADQPKRAPRASSTKGAARAVDSKSGTSARNAKSSAGAGNSEPPASANTQTGNARNRPSGSGKLSYKLQRELDALPDEIDRLESELVALQTEVGRPELYQQPRAEIEARLSRLNEIQRRLDEAVERWAELEQQAGG
jgi:ATP-binding cassette subfamily F protein uup